MESDVRLVEQYLEGRVAELHGRGGPFPFTLDVAALGWRRSATSSPPSSRNVLSIRLAPGTLVIGPFGQDPCGRCLERRWWELRLEEQQKLLLKWVDSNAEEDLRQPQISPFSLDALWSVVTIVAGLNGGGKAHKPEPDSSSPGAQVWVLDLSTHHVLRHGLLPDASCPVCAGTLPSRPEGEDWPLRPSPRPNLTAQRLKPVSEILLPEETLTNQLCGTVGPIAIRDYNNPVTAPVIGEFWMPSANSRFRLHWGGHGNSYSDSLTIGLIEGLERRAGAIPVNRKPEIFDSYNNLKSCALDPRETGEYETEFLARSKVYWVPFTEDMKMYWVWGYSLTERRYILVPEQLVYYCNHSYRQPLFVHECSNGCASGTSFEEAILYALLELMERDEFLITWFAKLALPKLDYSKVRDRQFQFICDRINRLGYDVTLFDMRLDMPIPVVLAVALRRDGGMGALSLAAGAGLDPLAAMWGAVCEIATYIGSLADRVTKREAEARAMAADFSKVVGLEEHTVVWGLPEMLPHARFLWDNPRITPVDEAYADWEAKRPRNIDQAQDIQYCVDRLVERGLKQVIIVDQTTREQRAVGLHTACAIVPGLLPIDFGYEKRRYLSLRRTFTVPRVAGLRDRDLTPADLNVAPHPFP